MDGNEPNDREPAGEGILHPEGMRAACDLAVGLVHEINNVLGVIIGNVHLARKNLGDVSALERYLREVRDAAEEGREVMRQLSQLGASRPANCALTSLNDLAHQIVSGSPKPVDVEPSEADPTVLLDPRLAQDALSSALGFMTATSSVTSVRVATHIVETAGMLILEDDGPAPKPRELASLFSPFVNVHGRPKVALDLTKFAQLAERHGGHVSATGKEPNGLRLALVLPLAERSLSADRPGVALAE